MRIDLQRMRKKAVREVDKRTTLINFRTSKTQLQAMDDIAEECKQIARVKLTRAFMIREGIKLFIIQLRHKLMKAKQGELHAKKRKD